ncbi:MAG: hypothetical protein Q9171_006932 [Xanthocarpia ochracea]
MAQSIKPADEDHTVNSGESSPVNSALQSESEITKTLKTHLLRKLQSRQYPKTICPSEIPRALSNSDLAAMGLYDWRNLMPQVRDILFDMRSEGQVEILQKGEVVTAATTIEDIRGPIRARLVLPT